jgi:16S rRNA (guanine527-N7)-methyltransferase
MAEAVMGRWETYRALLVGRVDDDAVDRLAEYGALLERWSRKHNLVRFDEPRELVDRHLLDAMAGARLLAGCGRLVDVGAGAGLPGVPLLVARPGWSGVLVEPRQKRWAFLKLVIRELALDAEAVDVRYEDLEDDGSFDLVTTRAVGRPEAILEWARPRLSDEGRVAFWTTVEGEQEIARMRGWRVLSWPLVGLDRGRLVSLRKCST